MKIEIAGPGCLRCKETEENIYEAVKQLGLEAEIVHIHDPADFVKKGVMFTPAVLVDGRLKFSGRVPTVEELKKALTPKPPRPI